MAPSAYTSRQQGFSLIEVLIALAIMSIALSALLLATSRAIHTSNSLRDRAFGKMVSENGLNLVLTHMAKTDIQKEQTLFQQTWLWQAKATNTSLPNIEQVTVEAHLKSNPNVTATAIGFRGIKHD